MARIRVKKDVPPPSGMPVKLQRFEPVEWMDPAGERWRVYRAMCDYYRARAEWFERNTPVSRLESYELASRDFNSGKIGYWTVLGSKCRVAVLRSEAGQGSIEELCGRSSCPCGEAGEVVATDKRGVR